MKKSFVALVLCLALPSQIALAQSAGGNGMIAIKTDPVLSNPKDLISIKTDPVLKTAVSLAGLKTDPVLSDPRGMISIKPDPVLSPELAALDLIEALEAKGVKVTLETVEIKGSLVLEVWGNGKLLEAFFLD